MGNNDKYNDKDLFVEQACSELIKTMESDMKDLYRDIEKQASSESIDTFPSRLNMLEKSKISAYINELLKKMRAAYSEALRKVLDEKGERRYTDSQVTLMWQSTLTNMEPPKPAYLDIRKLEADYKRKTAKQNPSIAWPIGGLGTAIAGWVAAGEASFTIITFIIRGVSVFVGVTSAYDIYKKKFASVSFYGTESNVKSDMIKMIVDEQRKANTEIMEVWICSVGESVKKGEPIL